VREQVVLVRDPADPVAARFIETARERFGLRTVVVSTDPAARFLGTRTQPVLRTGTVAATYTCAAHELPDVLPVIAQRWDVRAMLPQGERYVVDAAVVAQRLGLTWADADVVRLFRDKGALKARLRAIPDVPRINATTVVASVADVRAAIETGDYERFVLKPNDGVGNSDIGFFSASASDDEIARHLGGGAWLMEEFLDGPEYCVNGQVDEHGVASTYSVQRTLHTSANGRPQIAEAFQFLRHDSAEFAQVSAYAEAVVSASGLTRSPFHMEVIVDAKGPCMVECAARVVGAGVSWLTTLAHDGSLDVFELALEDYLGRPSSREVKPDWDAYDRRLVRITCGIHDRSERVARLPGARLVEAMPEYAGWVAPLRVGERVYPTTSLFTSPWILGLMASDEERLIEAEARARATMVINPPSPFPVQRVTQLTAVAQRVVDKAVVQPRLLMDRPIVLAATGSGDGASGDGASDDCGTSPRAGIRPVRSVRDLTHRSVLRIATLPPVRSAVSNDRVFQPLVHRYMGGVTEDEVLARLRAIHDEGQRTTVHLRLDLVTDDDGAAAYVAGYTSLVGRMVDEGLARESELSVKLEQLGYKTSGGLDAAVSRLREVCDIAFAAGSQVTVDMEGPEEVQDTIDAVTTVRAEHPGLGIVLQANLVRSEDDCRAFAAAGARVRLVKGGYHVPDAIGFTRRADVDRSYVRCLRALMQGDGYPMVATHDDRLVVIAKELAHRAGRGHDDYELQMLIGAREDLQRAVVQQGEPLRVYVAYGPEWYPWVASVVAQKPTKLAAVARDLLPR